MEKEIYVLVAAWDGVDVNHGPLVMEQYTDQADFESVKKRIDEIGGKYGPYRLAKLEFIDNEGI